MSRSPNVLLTPDFSRYRLRGLEAEVEEMRAELTETKGYIRLSNGKYRCSDVSCIEKGALNETGLLDHTKRK